MSLPPRAFPQGRQKGLEDGGGPDDVDLQTLQGLLQVDLLEGAEEPDPDIGEHRIDPAVFLQHRIAERSDPLPVGDVERHEQMIPRELLLQGLDAGCVDIEPGDTDRPWPRASLRLHVPSRPHIR